MCLVECHFQGIGMELTQTLATARQERIESQSLQLIETAKRIKSLAHLLADIALAAHADLQPPEARMPNGYIGAQITDTSTMGAVRVSETSARCSRRIRPWCICRDSFQGLVDLAFRHVL